MGVGRLVELSLIFASAVLVNCVEQQNTIRTVAGSAVYKNPKFVRKLRNVVVWVNAGLMERQSLERRLVSAMAPSEASDIRISSLDAWPPDATEDEIKDAIDKLKIEAVLAVAQEDSWKSITDVKTTSTSLTYAVPLLGLLTTKGNSRTTVETVEHSRFNARLLDAQTGRLIFQSEVTAVGEGNLNSAFVRSLIRDLDAANIVTGLCPPRPFKPDTSEVIRRRAQIRWDHDPCANE